MIKPGITPSRGAAAVCLAVALLMTPLAACGGRGEPPAPTAGSGDEAFRRLPGEILEFTYRQNPAYATYLGIHKYDDPVADYSAQGVRALADAVRSFRLRLDDVDAQALSADAQLDLEQTKHTLDGMLLREEVIRPLTKDPDVYSSDVTNDAFVLISRTFAPQEQRLRSLIARMRSMPDALAQARTNLDNSPRVYTEIAIDPLDGNRAFFANDVPAAFADVAKDQPADLFSGGRRQRRAHAVCGQRLG